MNKSHTDIEPFPEWVVTAAHKHGVDYSQIQATKESQYSCIMPHQMDQVSKIYKSEITVPINRILDATANVGCDSIQFIRMFPTAKLTSTEINPITAKLLKTNMDNISAIIGYEVPNPITALNINCVDYLEQGHRFDIVYFDPPWGGPDYYNETSMKLTLNDDSLGSIVGKVLTRNSPLVVIRIPVNTDMKELINSINAIIKDDISYTLHDVTKPKGNIKGNISYRLLFIRYHKIEGAGYVFESTKTNKYISANSANNKSVEMANVKPTLESTVTRYRREASRNDNIVPELEVRLQDVDYANFSAIYAALLAKKSSQGSPISVDDGTLTQMISAIMNTNSRHSDGPQRHLRPNRIREIFFNGSTRLREQFVRKDPLLIPFRVPSTVGLSYIVALSAESVEKQGGINDEGTVIRVKARVSFILKIIGSSELRPELHWRIDMTITRKIMGSDAITALQQIKNQMFTTVPVMTPSTFLTALHLDDDANPANRQLYRYEVEAEFVGPDDVRDFIRPADVTNAAESILRLANPEYIREAIMQAEIYRTAQYVIKAPGYLHRFQRELGMKRLLPQALAITRADYRGIYPPKGLYITEKADGKRAIAIAHDGRGMILSDILYDNFTPDAISVRCDNGDTILDGELIMTLDGKISFYAFDLIAICGEDVTLNSFEKRLSRIPEAVEVLRLLGLPIHAKGYVHLVSDNPVDLARDIKTVYDAERIYKNDGLIFVEPGKPYTETANYKWKPPEHNTIDMLTRRAPSSVLGKIPFIDKPGHKLHFLFVGINPDLYDALGLQWCPGYSDLFGALPQRGRGARGQADDSGMSTGSYFPIQFSPSDVPLAYIYQHPDNSPYGTEIDGSIIEVRCTGECAAAGGCATLVDWEITRIREDRKRELATNRYFGNDFYTAELIWLNYFDPFPIEQLWNGPSLDYFMRTKSGIYNTQTAVTSFVKTQRIASLQHAGWVVDIGIGKGQDLGRYLNAEVQHLVAVDKDRAALSELVRRKYSFAKRPPQTKRNWSQNKAKGSQNDYDNRGKKTSTTIHALAADANSPYNQTLDRFEALGLVRMTADAMVCNLAVHYFLKDVTAMRNFVALARGTVKIGGQVILTILIGEAVHSAFTEGHVPDGGTWDIFESDGEGAPPTRKYSLKRLYSSEKLETAGQKIGVLLPFSAGNYYEEYLVNTTALSNEFTSRGFSVAASTNVAMSIPDFETRNRGKTGNLTDGDRKMLSMYGELVFYKNK